MPLPQIERRVMPRMGGADYLGPEMRGDNLSPEVHATGAKVSGSTSTRGPAAIIGKSDD